MSYEKNIKHERLKKDGLLGPVSWCLEYIGEEVAMGSGLMTESIIAFEHQPTLLKIARDKLLKSKNKNSVDLIDKLLKMAPGQSKWARKQKESDFADINRHSIVSL